MHFSRQILIRGIIEQVCVVAEKGIMYFCLTVKIEGKHLASPRKRPPPLGFISVLAVFLVCLLLSGLVAYPVLSSWFSLCMICQANHM